MYFIYYINKIHYIYLYIYMYVCVLVCIITVSEWSADHFVDIDAMIRAWKVRDSNSGRGKIFPFLRKVQTSAGAYPVLYWMDSVISS